MPERRNFLQQVVEVALAKGLKGLKETTIVFANKRAGLYFINELSSELAGKASWAPEVLSFEELVNRANPCRKPDRFTLIFQLFKSYESVYRRGESLENFYFWGEMLLQDFEEIDHQLVNPDDLFKNLKDFREIEAISYLDEYQLEIIKRFWKLDDSAKYTEEWVRFWEKLGKVYHAFQDQLTQSGESYYGRQIRMLTENLDSIDSSSRRYIFAGFNAMTKSELRIIEHFMKSAQNSIVWDYDGFYLNSDHEAGRYLRQNRRNDYFAKFFDHSGHSGLTDPEKKISIVSTSSDVAQIKLLAASIQKLASDEDWIPEKTVIVLPSEKMLFPVLNSLSEKIEAFNITMGLSLSDSYVYEIYEFFIKLEKTKRKVGTETHFSVKSLLDLARHPLIRNVLPDFADRLNKLSIERKKYRYSWSELVDLEPKLEKVFNLERSEHHLPLLVENIQRIFNHVSNTFDQVYFNAFLEILTDLKSTLEKNNISLSLDGLHKLIRRSSLIKKVQFSGEPVKGLQIMGVLETRNVDFDHVFMLNMNEEYFPGPGNIQSFIPQNLRRAFGLQTINDNQSIQSYIFYRLIQRCQQVHLYYNGTSDSKGGDTSRFIHQLNYSFPVKPHLYIHEQELKSSPKKIDFSGHEIFADEALKQYEKGGKRYLSPSALHTYLECGLKFYFKYILNLKPNEEPEDEVDARIFGNLVHKSIEACYKKTDHEYLDISMITDEKVNSVIEQIMEDEMGHLNKVDGEWKGNHLIARTMLTKTLFKLIENDKKDKEISIYAFEDKYKGELQVDSRKVNLAGLIDRVDVKDGHFRVIDYKTGSDNDVFNGFEELREGKKKAIFQLFMYAWLFYHQSDETIKSIQPIVYRTKSIFDPDYQPCIRVKKNILADAIPYMEEFEAFLKSLLEGIFVSKDFPATDKTDVCKYCDFIEICRK